MLRNLFIVSVLCACVTSASDPTPSAIAVVSPPPPPSTSASPHALVEPFVPTDEWQPVLDGQSIPPGLHVRMDLSAGGRWAKNLPPSERGRSFGSGDDVSTAAVALNAGGSVIAVAESAGRPPLQDAPPPEPAAPRALTPASEEALSSLSSIVDASAAERARVLLELPQPELELEAAVHARMPPAELAALLERVWGRRQAELATAWASFKTEAQQMRALIDSIFLPPTTRANSTNATATVPADALTPAALVDTLTELEYFVASVHNAEDFAAMGGLRAMARLMSMHVSSSSDVAATAAWVLGTAVKGQGALIDVALDDGALVTTSALLEAALATLAIAPEDPAPPLKLAGKAVYALGALTRFHARGQRQFLALGGARALAAALDAGVRAGDIALGVALLRKSANLVADLAQPLLDVTLAEADATAQLRLRIANGGIAPQSPESNGTAATRSDDDTADDLVPTTHASRPSVWQVELAVDTDARTRLCVALEAAVQKGLTDLGEGEIGLARSVCVPN